VSAKLVPPARDDIRRILVIKWSALGDVVMATALMEDIRLAFPDARIDLNTLPASAHLFAHDPRFDEVFAIDVRKKGARRGNALAWIRRVRRGHYDLVIDLQRTDHTRTLLALLLLTGGIPRHRVGNRGGFPYTRTPAVTDPKAHAFTMMRSVLESIGISTRTNHPVLHAGAAHLEQAGTLMRSHGLEPGRFAVFLPGSQAAGWLKRWGVERFQALAVLLRNSGMAERIAIIGGPDEVDDCRRIAEAGDFLVNLNGRIELLEIAPLCAQAAFIIANDTGTAHIAAAADRPMLVICGPTDPSRVKPIGERVRAIQAELPCRSCYAKDCLIDDKQRCMRMLSPEFVAAEIEAMLAGNDNPMTAAVPIRRVTGLP
jgi:heptosyltransferase-2